MNLQAAHGSVAPPSLESTPYLAFPPLLPASWPRPCP